MSRDVKIVWYDSPEAVDRAMWEPIALAEGLTYDDVKESTCECTTLDGGEEVTISQPDAIGAIRQQGCWAFVDTKTQTIHAWADPKTPAATVIHMLGHELGHITGQPHEDLYQEERRAEEFGAVAAKAFELWSQSDKTKEVK